LNFNEALDLFFKVINIILSSGLLAFTARIFIRIGELKQWQATIDKEVASHGAMLQQLTMGQARMEGRLEDGSKKLGD
jgi:hypothetical protein